MTQDQKNAAVAAAALLKARQQAANEIVKACFKFVREQQTNMGPLALLEVVLREASGRGFDLGVKAVSSHASPPDTGIDLHEG